MIKKPLFLFFTIGYITLFSQIDTLKISKTINALTSIEQHTAFWKEIERTDQKYRGVHTIDSIDVLNLVKSSMYLNKFGYPKKENIGQESSIISIVWAHSKYPKASQYTFPIIFEGYKTAQISLATFRDYYIRGIYNRFYDDKRYNILPIDTLINIVSTNKTSKINIHHLLELIEEEKMFLAQNHKLIGIWCDDATYDTLYFNNKPIVAKNGGIRLRIFQDNLQNYYYNNLVIDESHYPQMLYRSKDHKNRFYIFPDHISYLEIKDDGNLYKFHNNKKTIYRKLK